MSKWRTIDSAPMNEYVLGFFPDFTETDQILICGKLAFDGDPDPPQWWERDETKSDPLIADPTHWMPIPKPPGRASTLPYAEYLARRQFIATAIQDGLTYTEIGRRLGLTRERIRQIVAAERLPQARSSFKAARERMALKNEEKQQRRAAIRAKYQSIIDAVEHGESINSASRRFGMAPGRAFAYLKNHGIRSTHESRNPKFRGAIS